MAEEVNAQFGGKWTHIRSENLEKFLEAMGFGIILKKLVQTISPGLTITVDGDIITVCTSVGPKKNTVSFRLGEEYDVNSPEISGKGFASWEGGRLNNKIHDPKKGRDVTTVREIVNGELVQTMTVEDVICIRYFKK